MTFISMMRRVLVCSLVLIVEAPVFAELEAEVQHLDPEACETIVGSEEPSVSQESSATITAEPWPPVALAEYRWSLFGTMSPVIPPFPSTNSSRGGEPHYCINVYGKDKDAGIKCTLEGRRNPCFYFAERVRCLPYFIQPGFYKCGTTALYTYLSSHPNVVGSEQKELTYFQLPPQEIESRIGWYSEKFPIIEDPMTITFEASTHYMFLHHEDPMHTVTNIFKFLPYARMVVITRDPVERTFSAFCMIRPQIHKNDSDEELPSLFHERIVNYTEDILLKCPGDSWNFSCLYTKMDTLPKKLLLSSLYAECMEPWLEIWPRNRFHFVNLADLDTKNPSLFAETMRKVEQFLGLPPHDYKDTMRPILKGRLHNHIEMLPETRQLLRRFFVESNKRFFEIVGTDYGWNS